MWNRTIARRLVLGGALGAGGAGLLGASAPRPSRGGPPTGTIAEHTRPASSLPRPQARRAAPAALDSISLAPVYAQARQLPRLRSLLVQSRGRLVGERYFHGATRAGRANIKSASKSVISALVGIAIARGHIRGVDQTLGELLPGQFGRDADPRKRAITVEDLLTMRSGLESTSFENYGSWVTSGNWVRDALRRPLVAEPGGSMIYSTGSTHLLSAILTRRTGTSTPQEASTRSLHPGISDATTGRPLAMASRITLGRPSTFPLESWTAGSTNTSAAR